MWRASRRCASTWRSRARSGFWLARRTTPAPSGRCVRSKRPDGIAARLSAECHAAGRAEIRHAGTRLIGSVAFFPETYGPQLIDLAFLILQGKPAPPAVFVKHILITSENVDHHYPNDGVVERSRRRRAALEVLPLGSAPGQEPAHRFLLPIRWVAPGHADRRLYAGKSAVKQGVNPRRRIAQ